MSNYAVQNQWGGASAPWNPGGEWILGNRDTKNPIDFDISSADGGKTFTGYMTYNTEGHIGFKATQVNGNLYNVENQWGGSSAPWNPGGQFIIGCRDNQRCIKLKISSADQGKTFNGEMTYDGEGPIGFKASLTGIHNYSVENQWGGSSAPWNPAGAWILSGRADQNAVAVNISSADGGKTYTGEMTYEGEGPIGFRGTLTTWNTYKVENQWGGSSAPWHAGTDWIIGNRDGQQIVSLNISSKDGGKTFTGEATFEGEGPIGFKASQV